MRNIKVHLNGQVDDYIVRSLHKRRLANMDEAENPGLDSCEIINITLCGALISVPVNTPIPDTKLRITIPSEAMNLANDTTIDSEIRWSSVHHATNQTRLGLMFTGMNRSDRLKLKKRLLSLDSTANARLPCRLVSA